MTVAVIIPTVPGREVDLGRTIEAFLSDDAVGVTVHPTYGHKAVGAGWKAGLLEFLAAVDEGLVERPEFVLFGNDDMRPDRGWLAPAIEASEAGFTPCPVMWSSRDGGPRVIESAGVWQVYSPDWKVVPWTPLCFFRLDEWHLDDFPPIHYWSDNWFATASIYRLGRDIVVRRGFDFTQTWAEPSRRSMDDPEAREAKRIWTAFDAECRREHAARRRPR